jgi:5-methylcytosine-specific restriction endonuclease McrA
MTNENSDGRFKTGFVPWNKGLVGYKTNYPQNRRLVGTRKKGYRHTEDAKQRIRESHTGPKHYNWKGTTPANRLARNTVEYQNWRKAIFERDDYTCVWCGKRGVTLNADHIKSWAHHPELRFVLDNGRTLCVVCHQKTDNYKGRGFKKIIRRSLMGNMAFPKEVEGLLPLRK